MAVERSLILIKPDAVQRRLAGEILRRLEVRGFTIRAGKLVPLALITRAVYGMKSDSRLSG